MPQWAPDGPSFRRLLNHHVNIPPDATRVHGYSREMLEQGRDDLWPVPRPEW